MIKNGFVRHVVTLMSGSATAQLIMVMTYFLLARLYGPEDIGQIRIYAATTLTMALMMNGGYELAVMLPAKKEQAQGLVTVSLRILAVMFVALVLISFSAHDWLVSLFNAPAFEIWIYVLPISIAMEGCINLFHQFLVRQKQYKGLAKAMLIYAFIYAAIALLGTAYHLDVNWLFASLFTAQAVKLLFYLYFYRKHTSQNVLAPEKRSALRKEYKQYPTWHLGSGLSNLASKEMITPLLSAYFSSAVAGLFSMANQILQLPMRFIMQAVPQVFYQRVAKAQRLGPKYVKKETATALLFLLLISALPTLLLAFFGEELFVLLLGEEWADSGLYVKYLAPFAVLSALASPITSLVNVGNKLKAFFVFNIILLLSRFGAISIGHAVGTADTAVGLFGIAAALGSAVLLLWMLSLGKFHLKIPAEK